LADAVPLSGGGPVPLASLRDRRALAFAGIAEPECFFEGLRTQGMELTRTIAFSDHVSYTGEHISSIARALGESGASLLLTTEKDGVKLQGLPEDLAAVLFVVRLKLVFEDPAQLTGALLNLLQY
jgi:tetraacyldisaccharide 4'-kinase